jgi:hypothetical protein
LQLLGDLVPGHGRGQVQLRVKFSAHDGTPKNKLLNDTNMLVQYPIMAHRKTIAKFSLFDKNIKLLQFPDGN